MKSMLESGKAHVMQCCEELARAPDATNLQEELPVKLKELPLHEEELRAQNGELILVKQTLEQEKVKYWDLFHFAPDGYLVTDLNSCIKDANLSACTLLKASQEHLSGKPLLTFALNEDRRILCDYLAEIQGQGVKKTDAIAVQLQPRDGPVFSASIKIAVMRNTDGAPVGFRWMIEDISERKRVEQALRQSEELYRLLAEGLPQFIWISSLDGAVSYCNQHWHDYTGLSSEQSLGHGWLAALHPEDMERTLAAWNNAKTLGKAYELEYRFRKSDGTFRWHLGRMAPIRDQQGLITQWLGTAGDIEKQKEAGKKIAELNNELEERVRSRTDELEAANREMETFCYSVSHDLRAPLRAIEGFAQILQNDCAGQLNELANESLRRIRKASVQMDQLIAALLHLSHATRQPLNFSSCDLSELAHDIVADLQRAMTERTVSVIIEPELVTYGDAPLLRTVLENLFSNAWKFTAKRPDAWIKFGAKNQGDVRIFYLQDNGAGFDMRHYNQLFEAFQRLHSARDFPGTGIGLATVQKIILRHGGRIWAEAEPGKGAVFFFSLPTEQNQTTY
jgi:PAS domain S-box-containing protein